MMRLYDREGLMEFNAYQSFKIFIPKRLRKIIIPKEGFKIKKNYLVKGKK